VDGSLGDTSSHLPKSDEQPARESEFEISLAVSHAGAVPNSKRPDNGQKKVYLRNPLVGVCGSVLSMTGRSPAELRLQTSRCIIASVAVALFNCPTSLGIFVLEILNFETFSIWALRAKSSTSRSAAERKLTLFAASI
jgi:hypothetical protein